MMKQDIKLCVDAVVFGYDQEKGVSVLLIKRKIDPFQLYRTNPRKIEPFFILVFLLLQDRNGVAIATFLMSFFRHVGL